MINFVKLSPACTHLCWQGIPNLRGHKSAGRSFARPVLVTPQGLRMLLGAFRGGNPLERIVGNSDKWSGKLPRYRLVGSEAAALLLPLEDDAGALGERLKVPHGMAQKYAVVDANHGSAPRGATWANVARFPGALGGLPDAPNRTRCRQPPESSVIGTRQYRARRMGLVRAPECD